MHLVHVQHKLREQVDEAGGANRERFRAAGVHVINLMSAPGSGKTTLLERTLAWAAGRWRVAVIEGDIQGDADAARLAPFGFPVRQINTHGACHLDPRQVALAAAELELESLDLLLIENVGNLVCPAEFDLGEEERVMLLSVAEGHDKPAKYPLMFSTADLLLLTKWDLLPLTDFDAGIARRAVQALNPHLEVLELSCRSGLGLDAWLHWLDHRLEHGRLNRLGQAHSHPHGEA